MNEQLSHSSYINPDPAWASQKVSKRIFFIFRLGATLGCWGLWGSRKKGNFDSPCQWDVSWTVAICTVLGSKKFSFVNLDYTPAFGGCDSDITQRLTRIGWREQGGGPWGEKMEGWSIIYSHYCWVTMGDPWLPNIFSVTHHFYQSKIQ